MANNGAAQSEKGLMNIRPSFVTDAQAAELMQPAEGAFNHPARFTQAATMGLAAPRQMVGYAPLREPMCVGPIAIGSIALDCIRPLAGSSDFAAHRHYGRQKRQQLTTVMHIGRRHLDAQGNSLGIGEKMMFAARFAAVGRVRPRLEPPKTARTLLESTTARDQSIRSATCNRRNNSWWSFSQTPAFCQSRNRRQQVMPLPQPISKGRSRQAMPVLSTKRIPVNAARSEIGLRPGFLTRRALIGSNGLITTHSESSSNGFAMTSLLQTWSKKYTSFCYTLLV